MAPSMNTTQARLCEASADDLPRIENMMQFFNYELSASYPINFGENGLYTLRPKQAYWSKPTVQAFLIRVGTDLAGFAVVDGDLAKNEAARQFWPKALAGTTVSGLVVSARDIDDEASVLYQFQANT